MGYVNGAPLVDFGRSERFLYYRQVYWLSSKGLELAEEEGLANGDAKANDDHSPRTLDHEHEISRFHFAVKEFCGSKQLDLYWRQHDLKKAVHPDALFAITDPLKPDGENTFYYFLEIERSKLGKYMNGEPQLLRKLVKYYEYYNSEECLGDWDDFNQFRVIVVVRTEARRRNLLTHLSDHYKHRMFWITTAELCGQDFGRADFRYPAGFQRDGVLACSFATTGSVSALNGLDTTPSIITFK